MCFGERKRPVKSSLSIFEAPKSAVLSKFADVLPSGKFNLVLQIKDDSWSGYFIDIAKGQYVPDRSVLKVVIELELLGKILSPRLSQKNRYVPPCLERLCHKHVCISFVYQGGIELPY